MISAAGCRFGDGDGVNNADDSRHESGTSVLTRWTHLSRTVPLGGKVSLTDEDDLFCSCSTCFFPDLKVFLTFLTSTSTRLTDRDADLKDARDGFLT